mmetsp:Transcript_69553/g.81192  ORF Transcript_69553/g.81192 Transcript_69553/m.81192 type:complete len:131 (-) Transcript_69553:710-1102(-)
MSVENKVHRLKLMRRVPSSPLPQSVTGSTEDHDISGEREVVVCCLLFAFNKFAGKSCNSFMHNDQRVPSNNSSQTFQSIQAGVRFSGVLCAKGEVLPSHTHPSPSPPPLLSFQGKVSGTSRSASKGEKVS